MGISRSSLDNFLLEAPCSYPIAFGSDPGQGPRSPFQWCSVLVHIISRILLARHELLG
ncbi:Tubulin alpha chain [Caligus rogercresseyi]|uniref:Tubulin alpha chain n=1 Tax=Caligus rogercresseyi TaxID=217165 RepID=A0A7T8GX17_CALRO|nr:Tubulin alpha chain [Caligus rogercresseyi]